MNVLIVAAPLKGWATPLSEVPDAVFAERMMGDGLAIDPLAGTLHAPFDGQIVTLPQSGHALAIRSDAGVEMLMHVGLDTVALGGEGFIAHVCEGQRVRSGDKLLSFDLDFLAQRAKSLVTPLIITNGERFDIVTRVADRAIEVGEPLMEVRFRSAEKAEAGAGGEARREVVLQFAHGLHARPAALVARAAQRFGAEISATVGARRGNAKSPVSLMTLGAKKGDVLVLEARGADADEALAAVAQAASAVEAETAPAKRAPVSAAPRSTSGEIRGVCAAPGIAIGVAVQFRAPEIEVREEGRGVELEHAALGRALVAVKTRAEEGSASGNDHARAIMAAHAALLDDPELLAAARARIDAGKSAGFAWRAAIAAQAEALNALGQSYLGERVADLHDLEGQVLAALGGKPTAAFDLPERAIVLADELFPSQFAALDPARLAGVCTARGGATSHVAILAQSLGVPALVAAGAGVLDVADGARVILDADNGRLDVEPSESALRAAEAAVKQRAVAETAARASAGEECRTKDGTRIGVHANLGAAGEAAGAVTQGAEGCGLLRTEFLFMDRAAAPSESEQREVYQAIADSLGGRPLVIRTLDAGADKPVAYLPMAPEENPALGVRGVRASLKQPELLRAQLRAILQVKPAARIMLPMVNDVAEILAVRAVLSELGGDAELGVMIETPAAAMLADQLAVEAAFVSIGTNDLAQYALAMDRGHPDLASSIDAMHPAVLRLIARTVEGARKYGRPVGVCGAIASEPIAAPLLIGLGADTLSAAPHAIPAIKARVRSVTLAECREAAQAALELKDAHAVRAHLAARWSTP
jgi:multiphosphoryl transfer protein